MDVIHHGAVQGVTGSCHQLRISRDESVLVDCGLFQGAETAGGADAGRPEIDFSLDGVQALLLTHCHLDHCGRIPYLVAAGFQGPILCTHATARLLPLVLEDALRLGITRDERLIRSFLKLVQQRLLALDYGAWQAVPGCEASRLQVRFQPAGHILGSAYVECRFRQDGHWRKVIFSGDLGAPYTPLLPAPRSPWSADLLVLESTYGDRLHQGRRQRRETLRRVIERAVRDRGAVLIPAFSIGRTQELLYELEGIIHDAARRPTGGLDWQDIEVVLDSPLAARFTDAYRDLRSLWDAEARRRVRRGRHPLSFEQLTTIDDHATHQQAVEYLRRSARPSIVIAASGMCAGGRIVNYLKALLGDPRTDVLFVGYQAAGTPGRDIQRYGPQHGYVVLDGERIDIRAQVHTLSGYSAHADQKNLVDFVRRMRRPPAEVRLVHGDDEAKQELRQQLLDAVPGVEVRIGTISP